jgi:hypothetical protein
MIIQVTWDEHSLFVRGERIFLYSGEFHPWRLPVVDLWKDVLQKIKALGYNGVSFGTLDCGLPSVERYANQLPVCQSFSSQTLCREYSGFLTIRHRYTSSIEAKIT